MILKLFLAISFTELKASFLPHDKAGKLENGGNEKNANSKKCTFWNSHGLKSFSKKSERKVLIFFKRCYIIIQVKA
jgi:hypothetical protein